MPTSPKLSVYFITYNQAAFVKQALDSVLMQRTSFDYEIIVGDDCSTDGTTAIIEDYRRRFPSKIKPVFHAQNVGMMRNAADTLAECRGDYIACLEGDDYWTDTDKIQAQVDFLDNNSGCAFCHHRVAHIRSPGGDVLREFPSRRFRADRSEPDWLAMLNYVQTCSVVFRRKWLPTLDEQFLALKLGDWPLFVLLSQRGWIGYLDRTMAHYRVHASNSWNNRPADYKIRAMESMAHFLFARVNDESKRLWGDAIIALAFKDLALALKTLSPTRALDRFKYFIEQSGKFGNPFWVLTRLWPYYKANYLSR